MKKRVLIATPSKGGLSIHYIKGLIPHFQCDMPDYEFEFLFGSGQAVNFERNGLAHVAMERDFDELIQVDSDMGWSVDNTVRLLSHNVDIVGGVYTTKTPGPRVKWLFIPKPGCVPDERGLLECNGLATGMLRTRVSALRRIVAANPDLMYTHREYEDGPATVTCNLFEMRVVGDGTPEARIEAVQAIVNRFPNPETKGFMPMAVLNEIARALNEPKPVGERRLIGEDYLFTRLARRAGIKCYADVGGPVIPHIGPIGYPVTKESVGFGPPGIPSRMPKAGEF